MVENVQEETFYHSVRMRASQNGPHEKGGKHISGGEKLSTYDNLKNTVNVLLEKGLSHSRGNPDFMQIQFETIAEPIKKLKPLSIDTNEVGSVEEEGQSVARNLLEKAGVPIESIDKAYEKLVEYSETRGAILFIFALVYESIVEMKKVSVFREWIG